MDINRLRKELDRKYQGDWACTITFAHRSASGHVGTQVIQMLPRVDPYYWSSGAWTFDWDECNSQQAEFHNEWKSAGSMMDLVVEGFSEVQMKLP